MRAFLCGGNMIYTKEDIKKIIPHREPMLLVDGITNIKEEEENIIIEGFKEFSGDEEFFKGHFPSFPIVPGVLILEAIAQVGACYILSLEEYKGKNCFFVGADNVKWRRSVFPKDKLIMKVTNGKIRHGLGKAHGEAYVNGELACQADLIVAIK